MLSLEDSGLEMKLRKVAYVTMAMVISRAPKAQGTILPVGGGSCNSLIDSLGAISTCTPRRPLRAHAVGIR
jgi:hypothetical protein